MKILFLADINSVHTKKWISSLLQRNVEIHLFSLSELNNDFYTDLENFKFTTANVKNQKTGGFFKKLSYTKQRKKLEEVYRDFDPDIVHAHYASSYGLLGSFLKHKLFLISIWGSDILDFPKRNLINRYILKRNFKNASHLFATSRLMGDEAKKYTDKKVEIIPFGVDTDLFRPIISSSDKLVIGSIKSLEDVYGINFLIEAYAKLLELDKIYENSELWIVGEGSKKEELIELSHHLKIQDKCKFLGSYENNRLPEIMADMEIIVVPSLSESFGVVAVEALACGKALIVSDVGGLPEIVSNKKNGLLSKPGDSDDIAECLSLLFNDNKLRNILGRNGRKSVLEKFQWSKNVDQMMKSYEDIIR